MKQLCYATVSIAALALAACGGAQADNSTNPAETVSVKASNSASDAASASAPASGSASQSSSASGSASGSAPAGSAVSPDERNAAIYAAIALAEQEAGGTAVSIDDEDMDEAWEVDVLLADTTVKEVHVSFDGKSVLRTENDDDHDDEQQPQGSLVDAIKAAVANTPGAVDDAEWEDDDSGHWKVEIDKTSGGDDIELRVDPAGNVTKED